MKVSAKKYDPAPAAAKVRFKVKGSDTEGVVFQGQKVMVPCKGCKNSQSGA